MLEFRRGRPLQLLAPGAAKISLDEMALGATQFIQPISISSDALARAGSSQIGSARAGRVLCFVASATLITKLQLNKSRLYDSISHQALGRAAARS
jgi:hypothetical protein